MLTRTFLPHWGLGMAIYNYSSCYTIADKSLFFLVAVVDCSAYAVLGVNSEIEYNARTSFSVSSVHG